MEPQIEEDEMTGVRNLECQDPVTQWSRHFPVRTLWLRVLGF